jgi:anaerobic ribonucleoside-triphosphate reductase activating protein
MRYAKIMANDTVDTPHGIAVSVWTQGCPFRCKGCHNPETWSFDGGQERDENEIILETLSLINANGIERDLAILGGEPLCNENISFTRKLITTAVKQYGLKLNIYLWTGYEIEEAQKRLSYAFPLLNLIITGPFVEAKRDLTLFLRGSSNQQIYTPSADSYKNITQLFDKK